MFPYFICSPQQLSLPPTPPQPPPTTRRSSFWPRWPVALRAWHSTHSVLVRCDLGPLERRSYPADVHKHDSLSNFHQSLFLAAFILWAAFGFWFFAFCLCYCYARRDIVTFGGTKEKQPIPTDGDGWIAACKIANLNIFTLPRYFLRYAVGHLCGRQGVEGAVPNGSRSAGDQTTKRFRMLMNAQIQQTNLNDSRSQSRRCRSPKLWLKS